MGDPSNQAKAIFLAAIEDHAPEQWPAFLDQACAGNADLRAIVEKLLRARCDMGSFHEQPHASLVATADEVARERPASVIGAYKLLEQIGEGGFGIVFMAEQQQPVRRKVALKVLKPGMDSGQVVARFEAERQALALMDHPNIARVLDGGQTASGRPYFVMDLVRGLPITDFADQAQLTPNERLELFISVCQAVQHAHQKGIIHRDLKPSNVLVTMQDGQPLVKVIDFGIAKALGQSLTDRTLFTGFAQMIGTPLYMSPEQAALSNVDVDTRSDVYSLGVLLYELLTGTTPFTRERLQQAGYDEMRRIIREEEPPKPSTRISTLGQAASTVSTQRRSDPKRLSQLFRGELDWIVMKALEKDRNRRYESASAFGADVQRYLHNETVVACPPSVRYRLRKFVRRNKGSVLAVSVFVLLLAAGVVGTAIGLVRALVAEKETSQALAQVTAEQARTATSLKAETAAKAHMREALDTLTDDVVQTMFARQPELEAKEKEFLRKVLGFYESATRQLGDTVEARLLRAQGFFKVGLLRYILRQNQEARVSYRQATILLGKLADDFPRVAEYRQKLATTYGNLGIVLSDLGNPAEAETALRTALDLREKLRADFPNLRSVPRQLAVSCNDLATLLQLQSRYADAEKLLRQSLKLREQLADAADAIPPDHQALARERSNLAALLQKLKKYREAEALYRQALPVQQKNLAQYPRVTRLRRELADSYAGLGIVLAELRKDEEAVTVFHKSMDIRKKLVDAFPNVPGHQEQLANCCSNLGSFLLRRKKFPEAEEMLRQAIELREQVVAKAAAVPRPRHDLAVSYDRLGRLLRITDRPGEGESAWGRALALRRQLVADFPDVPDYRNGLAGSLGRLARLYVQRRQFAAAVVLVEEALPHNQAALAANPGNRLYRDIYRTNLIILAQGHGGVGNHVRLATTAEELARFGNDSASDTYIAACMFCTATRLAARDARLTEPLRQERAQRYSDRALALLRLAVALGFKDVRRLKHNPDLEPLRARDGFRELLAEVEAMKE
jgi:serine/threonine protein kinase/tetratricopeptide (TPR) repeat protein